MSSSARVRLFAGGLALIASACSKGTGPAEGGPPRLVVLVVVDQLRGDELEAHRELFREGLRRLMDQGRWYTQATHGHARTETAAGHASISTGLHPKDHGVVEKKMYDVERGRVVGVCNYGDGECDPVVLRADTLGDRLHKASPHSKVVALAEKSRSAMLLGGHDADLVAWGVPWRPNAPSLHGRTRGGGAVPSWLLEYRAQVAGPERIARIWELPRLPPKYDSWLDAQPGESDPGHGVTFPHRLPDTDDLDALYEAWFATPDSDRALVETALKVVTKMELGADEHPDLLLISLGGFDAIGHEFGPDSVERLAALTALDRQLGDLFNGLASSAGSFVLALSSDHGVAPTLPVARARGHTSVRVALETLRDPLEKGLAARFGPGPYVQAASLPFIKLRDELPAARAEVLTEAVRILSAQPHVHRVWSLPATVVDSDPLTPLVVNMTYPGRTGDLFVALDPYVGFLSHGELGANHGTPWDYDRHVPVLLWGPGFTPARIDTPVEVISMTRTLGDRLGLTPLPQGAVPLP